MSCLLLDLELEGHFTYAMKGHENKQLRISYGHGWRSKDNDQERFMSFYHMT